MHSRDSLLLVLLFAAAACAPAVPGSGAPPAGSAAANKALVLRFHDALNRQDWALLDRLVTADYRHHIVTDSGFQAVSWQVFRRGNARARSAFPDWTNTPTQVTAEGNRVSTILIGRGTHQGSLTGEPPTGRRVTVPISLVHEIRNGRLSADWEVVDTGALMRALNPMPRRQQPPRTRTGER